MSRLDLTVTAVGLALWAAACGGKSANDGSSSETNAGAQAAGGDASSGGAQAAGGDANAGSSAASAGGHSVSSVCPSAAPQLGEACLYRGGTCSYELAHCTWLNLVCVDRKWASAPQADGAAYTCSSFAGVPPVDGSSCECQGLLDCTYNDCAGVGSTQAVCDNTSWHVSHAPCAARACGPNGLACQVGEACLHFTQVEHYECQPDPCAAQDQTTSCDCASVLCGSINHCAETTKDSELICF